MPEERARIEVDRLARCCSALTSGRSRRSPRRRRRTAVVVGDVMADATLRFAPIARERGPAVARAGHVRRRHRPPRGECPPGAAPRIAEGLSRVDAPVVFPAHPRTAAVLRAEEIALTPNVEVREPLGYLAFASAASQARVIATDSGGLQKEAVLVPRPVRDHAPSTEWVDTVEKGANVLVDDDPDAIEEAFAWQPSRRTRRRSTATATRGADRERARRVVNRQPPPGSL
jgi:UDP-N-acetylglucosamine 2-epimerase (non-hydrolysing)